MEQVDKNKIPSDSTQSLINDYKVIVKYLAFLACQAKALVRQNLSKETPKLLDKFSTVENIFIWNRDQSNLISSLDKMKYVVLAGGNGAGKTLILKKFAMEEASKGESVHFLIHEVTVYNKSLLALQLQEELGESVKVKLFRKLDEEICDNRTCYIVDEYLYSKGCL